jgi:hypothetical protein
MVLVGMASVRYIATLLYGVKATDVAMLAFPSCAILAAAVLAALPGGAARGANRPGDDTRD